MSTKLNRGCTPEQQGDLPQLEVEVHQQGPLAGEALQHHGEVRRRGGGARAALGAVEDVDLARLLGRFLAVAVAR